LCASFGPIKKCFDTVDALYKHEEHYIEATLAYKLFPHIFR